MRARAISALLATAGAAAGADGQNTATYQIVFTSNAPGTTGSGTNAITVPQGAAVKTVVSVLINPGLGMTTPGGMVWGVADGSFSLSGSGPAGMGSWGNLTIPAPYNFLYGLATTSGTIAGYSVSGAIWGTGAPWVVPVPTPPGPITNPDNVWEGTFTVSPTAVPTEIAFSIEVLRQTIVWIGVGFPSAAAFQTNGGLGGTITIIPAPAGLALLGLGGLTACRRPRRSQEAWT